MLQATGQQLQAGHVALDLAAQDAARLRSGTVAAATVGEELRAGALAQVAEAVKAQPAGKADHGRGAHPRTLGQRFGGVEGELVEVIADEGEDAEIVGGELSTQLMHPAVDLGPKGQDRT